MYRLTISCTSQADSARLAEALESIDGAFATGWQETDERLGLFEAEAYFHEKPTAEALRVLDAAYVLKQVEEKNWIDQSLQQFQPVRAGRFFVHGSHHRADEAPGAISIKIDAGLAFGTGHHETTAGCLIALDRLLKHCTPYRILDLGTGTGVLAIAAAKALRRPVLASDIDPVAVAVTTANVRDNHVQATVQAMTAAGFAHARLSQGEPFDLIMANILANPLMAMANLLTERVAPGGYAILSGLLSGQAARVSARYRTAGLVKIACQCYGEWAVLTLYRPRRPLVIA